MKKQKEIVMNMANESSIFSENLQTALHESLKENEKLRTELAISKQSLCELDEKAANIHEIRALSVIEVEKHRAEHSKRKDELRQQKQMLEQYRGYLASTEDIANKLKYKLEASESANANLEIDLSKTQKALAKESETLKLRVIEFVKESAEHSKTKDELCKQKQMLEQYRGYLTSTEEIANKLQYKLETSESAKAKLETDLSKTRKILADETKRLKAHAQIIQKITEEKKSLKSRLLQYTEAYKELTVEHKTLEDMMDTEQFFHQQKVDDLQKQLDKAREIPEFPEEQAEAEEEEEKKKGSAGCNSSPMRDQGVKSKFASDINFFFFNAHLNRH